MLKMKIEVETTISKTAEIEVAAISETAETIAAATIGTLEIIGIIGIIRIGTKTQ
jgi:hypothetical protein